MGKINLLSKRKINKNLNNKEFKIIVKKSLSSTNDFAKKIKNTNKKFAITSETQNNGRGRFDRFFYSPKYCGIYLSLVIPLNISIEHINKITPYVGLCVANVIEKHTDCVVNIKWVNDIILNDKKIGGILSESEFDYKNNLIKRVIIGIGINILRCSFPIEINKIASSIENELNLKLDRNLIVADIINELNDIKNKIISNNFYLEYKNKLNVINKKVMVYSGSQSFNAKVVDLTRNFELLVDKSGEIINLNSGEISLKIM